MPCSSIGLPGYRCLTKDDGVDCFAILRVSRIRIGTVVQASLLTEHVFNGITVHSTRDDGCKIIH